MARSASDSFGIAEAQIVALFMESVVYGIYLVTFFLCMRVLLFTADQMTLKRLRDINWPMVVVAFLMGLFATLDVAFGLRHNLDAFIYYSGPAEDEFHDINYWVNIMKTVDFVAQTSIGDAILISRCHTVYNRRWLIIVLPIALWLMTIGAMMIWIEATAQQDALLNDPRITPWLDTLTACTLVVNVLVTSLIVWRIWSVRVKAGGVTVHPHRLSKVMRIILDSGAIYTICVIVFFGTTLAGSNAQYGVSDVVVQVIGITFNMILIRVHNGSAPDVQYSTTGNVPSFPLRFVHTTSTVDPRSFATAAEVEVEVEVNTRTDTDQEDSFTKDPWKHGTGLAV